MVNFKSLISAVCMLCAGLMVQAQWKSNSTVTPESQSQSSKVVIGQKGGKVLYGYCTPNMRITAQNNGLGLDMDRDVKITAAIRLSEGTVSLLKGRKLYRVRVGAVADVENATVFIRKGDGTLWQERTTSLVKGWNDITFETPLEMPEARELYVGYTFMQKYDTENGPEFVMAAEASGYKENGIFLAADDEPLMQYSNVIGKSLCVTIEVDGAEEDFNYVGSFKSAYAPLPYLPKGAGKKSSVTFNYLNEGELPISKVTFARSFNGKEMSDTVCYFKRSIFPNKFGKMSVDFAPTETGEYAFTLKAIEDAPVSLSPTVFAFSVYEPSDVIQRTVLLEEFTSQSCGNCPAGQKALLETVGDKKDQVALVLHHSGYEPDAFTVTESEAYCYFYDTAVKLFAPAMMMDRTWYADYNAPYGNNSPIFDPRRLENSKLDQQLNTPAMISVGIKSSYDEATRKLSITVSGYSIVNLVGKHVGLNVYLLESKYIGSQLSVIDQGTVESYEHNNFLRDVISNIQGDVIEFNSKDGSYVKEYTYTIPEKYITPKGIKTTAHPENMHLVAFVSNFDTEYADNCVVLNASKTSSLNDVVSGLKSAEEMAKVFTVYVKDGAVCVGGDYENFALYNMQGMAVRNERLSSGIYIVRIVDTNHQVQVQKILVP